MEKCLEFNIQDRFIYRIPRKSITYADSIIGKLYNTTDNTIPEDIRESILLHQDRCMIICLT